MFNNCESITSIYIGNISLNNIESNDSKKDLYSIEGLFKGCKNLEKISMKLNFKENIKKNLTNNEIKDIFEGLPEKGTFYCDSNYLSKELLNYLPKGWEIKK